MVVTKRTTRAGSRASTSPVIKETKPILKKRTTREQEESEESPKKKRGRPTKATIKKVEEEDNSDRDVEDSEQGSDSDRDEEMSENSSSEDQSERTNGKSAAGGDVGESVVDYEEERQRNIQKNQELMESLGLAGAAAELFKKQKRKIKKLSPKKTAEKKAPTRFSARLSAVEPKYDGSTLDEIDNTCGVRVKMRNRERARSQLGEIENDVFNDSSVLKYTCDADSEDDSEESIGSSLTGFTRVEGLSYFSSALSRIYSLDYSLKGNLFAAGGHQGIVAIFGIGKEELEKKEEEDSLMTFKAHTGWLSNVQFVTKSENLLITSSNDSGLAIWDINKAGTTNRAQQIAKNYSLHTGGIFCMQERDGAILTASKDSSVGYSKITGTDIKSVRNIKGYHSGVIKVAALKPLNLNIFASGGNDLDIEIMDLRADDPRIGTISRAHEASINSVTWHPTNENLLMSAGFDPKIQLFDVRNLNKPLFTLTGHVNGAISRFKSIYHPIFCANGTGIITPGPKSTSISLFSPDTGKMISKGVLGYEPSTLCSKTDATTQLLCSNRKGVVEVLLPQWKKAEKE